MKLKFYITIFAAIFLFITCKKDKAQEQEEEPVALSCDSTSFVNDILPILVSYNCGASSCHSTTSAQGGVRLTNYSQVSAVDANRLLGSIKKTSGFTPMPAGATLSSQEINTIECWINDGKLNN